MIGVVDGLARMFGITVNGRERVVALFRPGDLMGSAALLAGSAEREYEVAALTPVRGIVLPRVDLQRIGAHHPEVLVGLMRDFSLRLDRLEHRLMAALALDVRVRLARLLLDLIPPDREDEDGPVPLVWPLTHREMAQIVAASRPHVSAVLAELEEEGALAREGYRHLLVRPRRLVEIAASD